MKTLTLALTLTLATPAFAQAPRVIQYSQRLAQVPSTAAAADRTLTFNTREVTQLAIVINMIQDTATDVTMVMRAQLRGSTLWGAQHSLAIAAGTVTLSPATYTRPLVGNAEILIQIPTALFGQVELVFAAPAGGATDFISVDVVGVTGGM